MAVTVTKAAPSTSVPSILAGTLGVKGSDTFVISDGVAENKRVRTSQLTLSGTYATGGFALTPSDYGLTRIDAIAIIGAVDGSISGMAATPVLTTAGTSPTVKLYTDNASTELANATSVTNWRFTALIVGV